jgi:hypothetical protein
MTARPFSIGIWSHVGGDRWIARPFVGELAVAQEWALVWLRSKSAATNDPAHPWEYWTVMGRDGRTQLPKIVAHGDLNGVLWSALDHGWVD